MYLLKLQIDLTEIFINLEVTITVSRQNTNKPCGKIFNFKKLAKIVIKNL